MNVTCRHECATSEERGVSDGHRIRESPLAAIETQAPHAYRPTDKRIAELADEWTFALANMKARAADTAAR